MCLPAEPETAQGSEEDAGFQPHLNELKEKHKEEKEVLTKETFGVYKRHGVNPIGGAFQR